MNTDIDAVYTSPAGTKFDPLALYRKLLIKSANKINDLLTDWQGGSDPLVSARAEESLVALARDAFALKPFDQEGGATDRLALDCLEGFLEFVAGKA